MKILVLNGSPRPNGNTTTMVKAFVEGAKKNNHDITVVDVCSKKISGLLSWFYWATPMCGQSNLCISKFLFGLFEIRKYGNFYGV